MNEQRISKAQSNVVNNSVLPHYNRRHHRADGKSIAVNHSCVEYLADD